MLTSITAPLLPVKSACLIFTPLKLPIITALFKLVPSKDLSLTVSGFINNPLFFSNVVFSILTPSNGPIKVTFLK